MSGPVMIIRGEEAIKIAEAAPAMVVALEGLVERLLKGDSISFARIDAAIAVIARARGAA